MATGDFNLLHDKIYKFMDEYAGVYRKVRQNSDWRNSFRDIIAKDIPSLLTSCCSIKNPYFVVGSYGKGRWTGVPWIAVFDRRITTSATKGVYIVYLLNKDSKELYLTLNQGATDVVLGEKDKEKHTFTGMAGSSSSRDLNKLRQRSQSVRTMLDGTPFIYDQNIHTGAPNYDAGTIFYKKYTLNNLPAGEILVSDLKQMIQIYASYYDQLSGNTWWPPENDYSPKLSKEEWLKYLQDPSIFTTERSALLKDFYDRGGTAKFTDIAGELGWGLEKIQKVSADLSSAVSQGSNCPLFKENGQEKLWPILFVGKKSDPSEKGYSIWKLRNELFEALKEFWHEGDEIVESSVKQELEKIESYIAAKGFTYPEGMIRNFYLSLKSKPFVILAGTSGTGKTKLVKLFAEAIGAKYKMVSVRPDWSDSSDLFGHLDLNGKFVPGPVLPFLSEAQRNPHEPFILCLDEMNLARVEYYLSDVLSVIETREKDGNRIISDYLLRGENYGSDTVTAAKFGEIRFPENLFLVGTVNMDETTFPFSKKVLDRANTIEFDYVDLIPEFHDGLAVGEEPQKLPADFLKSNYLFLAQCEDREYVTEIGTKLQSMNEILQKAKLHVGYRVRDEISFYMLNNKNYGLLSEEEAFDNEIMQKVLPRIQGSSASVKDVLCDLFRKLTNLPYETESTKEGDISSKMLKALDKNIVKYPKSANKIAFMVRRFEEDGFTSYWL